MISAELMTRSYVLRNAAGWLGPGRTQLAARCSATGMREGSCTYSAATPASSGTQRFTCAPSASYVAASGVEQDTSEWVWETRDSDWKGV